MIVLSVFNINLKPKIVYDGLLEIHNICNR